MAIFIFSWIMFHRKTLQASPENLQKFVPENHLQVLWITASEFLKRRE